MSFTHIVFHTLYTLVSRPSCSTGKLPTGTGKCRTEPHRGSLRGCMPLKNPEVYFFVLPLWTDARNLIPVSRTRCGISFLPFVRVSRFDTPFCTTSFQGVRQSYALKASVGNHDPIQNAAACKSEQSKNFAAVRHNAHKPRRAALLFLWFFSERAGRTAQRTAQGFSEKANLRLGIIYLGYRFGTG